MYKKIKTQKIILTVGIPTYNRQKKLEKCLESVIHQQADGNVEILISDNASQDATQEYVREVMALHELNIRYIRNKANEGFDNNIISIYKNAKGRYIWFLSDDDEILPGALGRVLDALIKHKPAVLYPNELGITGESMTKNDQFVDIVSYLPTGLGIRVKTDEELLVNKDVARLAVVRLASFISCCIGGKQNGIASEILKLNYSGTGLVQDAIMSLVLLQRPTVYLLKTPSVRMGLRASFSKWSMESTLFGFRKLYSNKALKYPNDLANKVSLNNCKFGLLILAQKKILKIPVDFVLDKKQLIRLIKFYKTDSFSLALFILVALISKIMPGFLIKASFQLVYRFAKIVSIRRENFSESII